MKSLFVLSLCFCISLLPLHTQAKKFDGLAEKPPMGWNTFNTFEGDFDEQLIKEVVDVIVATGMKEAGYEYIIIDDNWTGPRDKQGFLTVDKKRFPNGLGFISDYIHANGLKLGLYSDAGYKTCAGYVSSRGHEFQDAMKFAEWGADYLKYDWCNTDGINPIGAYTTMRDAIHAAGRPMVFSMCEWGTAKPWEWAGDIAHLWRTTGDIYNCWDCKHDHGGYYSLGFLTILDMQEGIRQHAGPGHWNDPDMLEVGNGMTVNEDRSHFSLWAILAAPLIAGNDVRNMSKETLEILTNREVINIDQDILGIQGYKYSSNDGVEVWLRPLNDGDWAVAFLNRADTEKNLSFNWQENSTIDELSSRVLNFDKQEYTVRDVWAKKDIGSTKTPYTAKIGIHDTKLLRLSIKH